MLRLDSAVAAPGIDLFGAYSSSFSRPPACSATTAATATSAPRTGEAIDPKGFPKNAARPESSPFPSNFSIPLSATYNRATSQGTLSDMIQPLLGGAENQAATVRLTGQAADRSEKDLIGDLLLDGMSVAPAPLPNSETCDPRFASANLILPDREFCLAPSTGMTAGLQRAYGSVNEFTAAACASQSPLQSLQQPTPSSSPNPAYRTQTLRELEANAETEMQLALLQQMGQEFHSQVPLPMAPTRMGLAIPASTPRHTSSHQPFSSPCLTPESKVAASTAIAGGANRAALPAPPNFVRLPLGINNSLNVAPSAPILTKPLPPCRLDWSPKTPSPALLGSPTSIMAPMRVMDPVMAPPPRQLFTLPGEPRDVRVTPLTPPPHGSSILHPSAPPFTPGTLAVAAPYLPPALHAPRGTLFTSSPRSFLARFDTASAYASVRITRRCVHNAYPSRWPLDQPVRCADAAAIELPRHAARC